jgi:hypothetical protein
MCSEADKRMFKALLMVLEQGRFQLTGKEALAFYKVYNWVKALEKKNTEKKQKVNNGDF